MANLVSPDGMRFELAETETLIGRGGREQDDPPKVDVGPLRGGPTVSRHHARVFRRGGQWYLRVEEAARNPTLVGGRRVPGGEEAALLDNTSIQLGDVVLTFRAPVEAPTSAPDMTMAGDDGHAVAVAPASAPIAAEAPAPTPPAPPPAPEPEAETPPTTATSAAPDPPPEPASTPASAPAPAPAPAPARSVAAPTSAAWAARLSERPSLLSAIGVSEFKRVNPFRGLMIDETAWADAHDYHRLHERLHYLSTHGSGVVEGLEVIAEPHASNTLVIRPGVAVDPLGRPLLVPHERRLPISAADGSTLYVVLRLHEELAEPQRFWNDIDEYTRVLERCQALVQQAPPAAPAIELARVTVHGPVRNAPDPMNPQPGEIDLRFRERVPVRQRPELRVAQLAIGDDDAASTHRLGLRYLLREVGQTTGYRPRWTGTVSLGEPLPEVSLIYFAGSVGFSAEDATVRQLREFLQRGGVVFADGCRSGKAAQFAESVERLAKALDCDPRPIERWHPLLTARHVFSAPPTIEKDEVRVAEGGGLIVTSGDFGCAWQGGPKDKAIPREAIRSALEFGVNVAVFARQRQHPLDVIDIEG